MKKKTYYIVIWKDHNGKIHRDECHYGGKGTAIFLFSDVSMKLTEPRPRLGFKDGHLVKTWETRYLPPTQTVLYLFKVNAVC